MQFFLPILFVYPVMISQNLTAKTADDTADVSQSEQYPEPEYIEGDIDDVAPPPEETEPTPGKMASTKTAKVTRARQTNFHVFLGMSAKSFAGSLALAQELRSFLEFWARGFYWQKNSEDSSAAGYGPIAELRLKVPNPTNFIPYAGGLLGYEVWRQEVDNTVFDEAESAFSGYLFGLQITLTKNFYIAIERQSRRYLSVVPYQKPGVAKEVDNPALLTEIRFGVMF